MLAAARRLASDPGIDPQRIGAVGWSRGALALLHAVSVPSDLEQPEGRATLRAAIGFYPTCPRQLDRMSFPFLLLHGDADRMAPIESCRSMTVKGAEQDHLEFIELEGARHFFDHPNRSEYDLRAAADAWSRVRDFLDRNLEAAR